MTIDPWRELLSFVIGLAVVGVAAYRRGQHDERKRCMSLLDQVWMSGRYSPSIGVVRDAVDSGAERIEQSQIRPHDREYRAHAEAGMRVLRNFRLLAPGFSRIAWESEAVDWLLKDDALDSEREAARKRRVGL